MLALLMAGCGGGGGDEASTPPRPSVSISANNVDVSSAPSNAGPSRNLGISVTNMPADGLFHGEEFSTNGLEDVQLVGSSTSAADLVLTFKPATELADGTYEDTIEVSICQDDQCRQHAQGSPMRVTTRYTVSGGTVNTATISRASVSVVASAGSYTSNAESMVVTVSGTAPVVPFTLQVSNTLPSLIGVNTAWESATQTRVHLSMNPWTAGVGVHQDTVTVRACYDARCRRQLAGSPFVVPVTYTVVNGAAPEPGTTPVSFTSRNALPHDVIDAKFSSALNAMVMVSSWPRNSLYVYDAASGTERELLLTRVPTRVSISPDGTRAAVGHDARVTYVDLTTAGTPGAAAPVLLDVAATVGDLVLDGRGNVIVFPSSGNWDVYAIHIATNTQTSRYGPIYAGTRGVLHPTRSTIYSANNGLSPDDIQNLDITSGQAVLVRDSPYHGDYPMCGNLWLSADGARIYTACGRTFRASTTASQDMIYTGVLPLSVSNYYGYRVASLSEWASSREVALIEYEWYGCTVSSASQPCWSHLNLYDIDTLARTGTYSLAPVEIGNTFYAQRGLFVFHRAGGSKLVISRLLGVTDPATEYHVSVLP
ncbi:MAG TPA: hypothetical protein VGD46_18845 [Rhizobacter sp.]